MTMLSSRVGARRILWIWLVVGVVGCLGDQTLPASPSEPTGGTTGQTPSTWYVTHGGDGNGTEASPFGRVQDALEAAASGDTVVILSGTYQESLRTQRGNVHLVGMGDVVVTASGRVLDVQHKTTIENLAIDGQFGERDAVRVRADDVHFRRVEVRNSGRDGIDAGAVSGLLVEDSHIHHCVWPGNDAHGLAGGRLADAIVRNTRIHDVTGDGIQLDAGRMPGHWELRVENVDISDTGEDGIDTKTGGTGRLTVVGGTYRGFRAKANSAAFNMKESVTVSIEGVTVSDANIGFRLRHPADVRLANLSVRDSDRGIRYEDGVVEHPLVAVTFINVDREIQRVD